MTRPEDVRCEHCCYWRAWGNFGEISLVNTPFENFGRDEFDDRGMPKQGECSCHPPVVSNFGQRHPTDRTVAHWPLTDHDEWCGEFRVSWPRTESDGRTGTAGLRRRA